MNKLFYKRMIVIIELNIFRACFDQSFFQNTLFLFVRLSRLLLALSEVMLATDSDNVSKTLVIKSFAMILLV